MVSTESAAARSSTIPSSSSSDAARSRPSEPASAATSSSPIRSTNNCSMAVARVPPTSAGRARRSSASASRISRRSKKRWPRTVKPIPARVNASSMAGSWAFVRTRTAVSVGATPAAPTARTQATISRSSASPSVKRWTAGGGPAG